MPAARKAAGGSDPGAIESSQRAWLVRWIAALETALAELPVATPETLLAHAQIQRSLIAEWQGPSRLKADGESGALLAQACELGAAYSRMLATFEQHHGAQLQALTAAAGIAQGYSDSGRVSIDQGVRRALTA